MRRSSSTSSSQSSSSSSSSSSLSSIASPYVTRASTADGFAGVYPPGWADDEQMCFMFAELPPATASAYTVRLRFWSNAVDLYLQAHGRLSLDAARTRRYFTRRDGLQPLCLNAVLVTLMERGELSTVSAYLASVSSSSSSSSSSTTASASTASWSIGAALRSAMRWLSFGARQQALLAPPPGEALVCIRRMRAAEVAVCQQIAHLSRTTPSECLLSEAELVAALDLPDAVATDDLQLVLRSLAAQGRIALFHSAAVPMVKIAGGSAVARATTRIVVNANDVALVQLHSCRTATEAHAHALNQTYNVLREGARVAQRLGRRDDIAHLAQQMRACEARLHHRHGILVHIDAIVQTIEKASARGLMLRALQATAGASRDASNVDRDFHDVLGAVLRLSTLAPHASASVPDSAPIIAADEQSILCDLEEVARRLQADELPPNMH